jgi:AcrR family transcriptional regulator
MRVKTEERREAIIAAATQVFCDKGFEVASMDMIAKQCGGSKATLYNYFSSKEEIFFAVVKHTIKTDFRPVYLTLQHNQEQPLFTTLSEFGRQYLGITLSPNVMAARRMVLTESQRSKISQHFYENGPGLGIKLMAEFFAHQVSVGRIIPCDPTVAAMHFKALLNAELFDPYQMGCIEKLEQALIDSVVERAVNAFLAIYQA